MLLFILFAATCLHCQSLIYRRPATVPRRWYTQPPPLDPFWEAGVLFKCTGCGKCCTSKGEVWFSTEEFSDLLTKEGISAESCLEKYAQSILSGWVKMKDKVSYKSKQAVDIISTRRSKCIFLDDFTETKCSIYDSRPVQCRTYPYWPSLLQSEESWSAEAVQPDPADDVTSDCQHHQQQHQQQQVQQITRRSKSTLSKRYWTAEDGGCEGINHSEAPVVAAPSVHLNQQLYIAYHKTFPKEIYQEQSSDVEKEQLLQKLHVIQVTRKHTKIKKKFF